MRRQAIDSLAAWPADLVPPRGILVLTGYGLDVRVWRGRLRVAEGIGKDRREAIIHRATGRLRRLVVLGHTGTVTLDAIRWLADVGAGYLQVDADGRVLAAFGPQGTDRPGLRRAQARALDTPEGDDIVRRILAEKVAGQAETLVAVDHVAPVTDVVVASMRAATAALRVAVGRDELRLAEAQAAAAYWSAWSSVPVTFARRDLDRVPPHWRTFGTRSSPLTGSPRLAGNPANALLNYLYALLEGEAAIAARIVGLDPGIGLLHSDQLNRDSLAADLMEPVRPLVDRFVLRLLSERHFAATDFHETRQGVCRVTPPLARELVATSGDWSRAVGRVAEDVARLLQVASPDSLPAPTPISGRNRSAGRGRTSAKRAANPPARSACTTCGAAVADGRKACSAACAAEAVAAAAPAFQAAGIAATRELRAAGWTPEMTEAGRGRLGRRTVDLVAAAREWQRTHAWPEDMAAFTEVLLPQLTRVPSSVLVEATGLSLPYCRRVQRGLVVPHPMWWDRLASVGAGARPDE
jgi:CRISPR-associated endonuclease Cas1